MQQSRNCSLLLPLARIAAAQQQGLDTAPPTGKGEFERAMIRERVDAGLERARAQGKTLGRPRTDQRIEAAIRKGGPPARPGWQ
jgi:hypothetical protein